MAEPRIYMTTNRRTAIELRPALEREGWVVSSQKLNDDEFSIEIEIRTCHAHKYRQLEKIILTAATRGMIYQIHPQEILEVRKERYVK